MKPAGNNPLVFHTSRICRHRQSGRDYEASIKNPTLTCMSVSACKKIIKPVIFKSVFLLMRYALVVWAFLRYFYTHIFKQNRLVG